MYVKLPYPNDDVSQLIHESALGFLEILDCKHVFLRIIEDYVINGYDIGVALVFFPGDAELIGSSQIRCYEMAEGILSVDGKADEWLREEMVCVINAGGAEVLQYIGGK
jgi:hypothetical protein